MRYKGGKNGSGVYQFIINQIPPHKRYIELFAGSGSILRRKRPARSSIAVEADTAVAQKLTMLDLPSTTVVCGDAISFLRSYKPQPGDFIYLDPPYPLSTRSYQGKIYNHDLSDTDHLELLSLIKTIPTDAVNIAISGYHNIMYNDALHGWRTSKVHTVKSNGKRSLEVLWMNYPEPKELHDYSFVGKNFRERERIKRKYNRWKNKITQLAPLERAMLKTIIHSER